MRKFGDEQLHGKFCSILHTYTSVYLNTCICLKPCREPQIWGNSKVSGKPVAHFLFLIYN